MVDEIVSSLEAGKATDVVCIDLKGRASFTDTLIIASGTSARQVMALGDNLAEKMRKNGYKAQIEGKFPNTGWVVLDFGDALVHILNTEARAYYKLEDLWKV